MSKNPYETYKQQSIMTMTRGEMLLKLYDEVIKQLNGAEIYIKENDITKTNAALQKTQKILNYLKSTLDFQYEISNNLASLYDYFCRQTISANIKKDAAPIKEILPMIEELRETFAQASRQAKI